VRQERPSSGARRDRASPARGRDLDALDRGQEQEAELLVEQVEVDGAAELGTWPELLAADGTRSIIRIEDDLLERLPIGGETRP
jgi:hypothetical protein